MFYVHRHKVVDTEIETAPHEHIIHLTEGVIHQVDVMFQSGSSHEIKVQVWQANYQVWPSNREESFTGDATIISFREFFPISPAHPKLLIRAWTADPTNVYDKYFAIHLALLPRRVIQPLSFEELLAAAAAIE